MTIADLLKQLRYRRMAALLFGIVVIGLNLWLAWEGGGNVNMVDASQNTTMRTLDHIDEAMQKYRTTHGNPPSTLLELNKAEDFTGNWEYDKSINDDWGRPIHYRVIGSGYEAVSYGRDGKRGGEGSDQDLTPKMHLPKSLSFPAFIEHDRHQVLVWSVVFMGLIAAGCALEFLQANSAGTLPMRNVVYRLLLTAGVVWFLSSLLTALSTFNGIG